MIKPYFQNIRKHILSELNKAEKEIVVAIYWFTNHELFDKLCEKKENGITVSLIVHNDFINNRENGLNFQKFIDLGGSLYFSDSENPMHNKFCVIDNKVLINGSYNWTYFAETKNNENILLVKEQNETINAFRKEFDNIKNEIEKIEKITKLTQYEIDEFNGLNSREYLANDIIYEAKATERPEIIKNAFEISPNNIKVQKEAVKLNLHKKIKLKHSIGAGIKGDKYLVGVEKGALLPITITRELRTAFNNQVTCNSVIYFGDKEKASDNVKMPRKGKNGIKSGVKIYGLPKLPAGEARMKMIFTIDLNYKLQIKFYSLDNGNADYFDIGVKNLTEELIDEKEIENK